MKELNPVAVYVGDLWALLCGTAASTSSHVELGVMNSPDKNAPVTHISWDGKRLGRDRLSYPLVHTKTRPNMAAA